MSLSIYRQSCPEIRIQHQPNCSRTNPVVSMHEFILDHNENSQSISNLEKNRYTSIAILLRSTTVTEYRVSNISSKHAITAQNDIYFEVQFTCYFFTIEEVNKKLLVCCSDVKRIDPCFITNDQNIQ